MQCPQIMWSCFGLYAFSSGGPQQTQLTDLDRDHLLLGVLDYATRKKLQSQRARTVSAVILLLVVTGLITCIDDRVSTEALSCSDKTTKANKTLFHMRTL